MPSYTNGRYHIDETAAYAKTEYKMQRQVAVTGFSDQIASKLTGDTTGSAVEIGESCSAESFGRNPSRACNTATPTSAA